jgi:hypothetical protein
MVFRGAFQVDNIEKDVTENTRFRFLIQDIDNSYWALFGCWEYGYYDYWIAHSSDQKRWDKYFTGIRIREDYKVRFDIIGRSLKIEVLSPTHNMFLFPIDSLTCDTDGDGLTNVAERRLFTSPLDEDTDHDGIDDFDDKNPLAVRNKTLTDREKILKLLVEDYLKHVKKRTAVVVTVPMQKDKIEFEYYKGYIICLTYDEHEEFRKLFDYYGITSLAAIFRVEKPITTVKFSIVRGYWDAYTYKVICKRKEDGTWEISEIKSGLEDILE